MIQHDPHPEYRAILCAECGDEALVVHSSTPASTIEGRRQECECCGVEGKVVLLDDEDVSLTNLEFRPIVKEWTLDDAVHYKLTPDAEAFAQFVFYHFGGYWIRGHENERRMAKLPARIEERVRELAAAHQQGGL